eukprot:352082-Chlamydomonas_euryale.AAC.1
MCIRDRRAAGGQPPASVSYLAPEQLEPGSPCAGAPSDVWAAGCVALFALTGRPPLAELNMMEAMYQVAVERTPPPLPLGLPPRLRHLLSRCLRMEPSERPSAALLAAELEALLADDSGSGLGSPASTGGTPKSVSFVCGLTDADGGTSGGRSGVNPAHKAPNKQQQSPLAGRKSAPGGVEDFAGGGGIGSSLLQGLLPRPAPGPAVVVNGPTLARRSRLSESGTSSVGSSPRHVAAGGTPSLWNADDPRPAAAPTAGLLQPRIGSSSADAHNVSSGALPLPARWAESLSEPAASLSRERRDNSSGGPQLPPPLPLPHPPQPRELSAPVLGPTAAAAAVAMAGAAHGQQPGAQLAHGPSQHPDNCDGSLPGSGRSAARRPPGVRTRSPYLRARCFEDLRALIAPKFNSLLSFVVARDAQHASLMIERGAHVAVRDPELGGGLLHWAAAANDAKMVSLLLDAGTPLDVPDAAGASPLHWAVAFGSRQAAAAILAHAASGAPQSKVSAAAAAAAAACAAAELPPQTLHQLQQPRSSLGGGGSSKDGLLTRFFGGLGSISASAKTRSKSALTGGQRRLAAQLPTSAEGRLARLNAADAEGWTPLHCAVIRGHVRLVEMLADKGAHVDLPGKVRVEGEGAPGGDAS